MNYVVNVIRLDSADTVRSQMQWLKIIAKILNYDTRQLSAWVKQAEYQNTKHKAVLVPNTAHVFSMNANTQ